VVTKQIEELTDGDESAKAIWVLLRSAWSFLQGTTGVACFCLFLSLSVLGWTCLVQIFCFFAYWAKTMLGFSISLIKLIFSSNKK
jgi:hypothetical protein